MKKVAVFFATGFEEVEGLAVVDILRRAGVSVDICSLNGEYVTTSRGPATVLEFAYNILNAMDLKDKADALREGMMVNFYNKNI